MKVVEVAQELVQNPIDDVGAEVRRVLDASGIEPRGEVAITVGSRGIDRIPEVIRAAGAWLRSRGAEPFVVPAMGSHNGATADGQRTMIESIGVTEDAVGMPIRASMDVVEVGEVESGKVWMDRHCFEADGVLVVNRIKPHTCFSGRIQSGLQKMMVVGMGKIRAAETFHSTPTGEMAAMLEEMAAPIAATGKILAGLAILEDGLDRVAELHAVAPADVRAEEPRLMRRAWDYFPRLPIDDLDLLVVRRIGKNLSGTGMDTNVIGRRGVPGHEDLDRPRIRRIAALELDPLSRGNAIGVGLADFVTRRLRDAIDEHKTFVNVFATGDMERMKIPATFDSDREMFRRLAERFGERRRMFVPDTLHLDRLFVGEDLVDELPGNCRVIGEPSELPFAEDRLALFGDR